MKLDYRNILTKRYVLHLSIRQIAEQTGASRSGVSGFLQAFDRAEGISFPLPAGITNEGIESLVYPMTATVHERDGSYAFPDFASIHEEMARRKNMTLIYLWNRYQRKCIGSSLKPYSYRQFCALYSDWCEQNDAVLTMPAYSGQSMEVDFAGNTFEMTNRLTGEILTIVVFVAVLPYSNRIYAEGMTSTKEPQWIEVNNHALWYFGGIPAVVVPDNCKQAVIANTDWIEPELNKDYEAWAEYYGTAILPAKVKHPRWKASVEGVVGILEKGLFHDLEERQYFSLDEFNTDLREKIDELNERPFKNKDHARNYYWEVEKRDLMPLPSVQYEYTERKKAKVSSDFHVRFDNAYYSADKEYLHKDVIIRATTKTVRIYSVTGTFICEHPRATYKGQHVTDVSHLPGNYRSMRAWSGEYFTEQAMAVGPNTVTVIKAVLKSRKLEVQTYRSCMGILRYKDRYGREVLEECCARAVDGHRMFYSYIRNTIADVASEMGAKPAEIRASGGGPHKGGIARSRQAFNVDALLSKSKDLLDRNRDLGQKAGGTKDTGEVDAE